ncbi:MAG: hypothetical protein ACREOW_09860 [Thermodesulfobacteriota bacterium]
MKRFREMKSEKGLVLLVVLGFTLALLVAFGGLLFSKGAKADDGGTICECNGPCPDNYECTGGGVSCEPFTCPTPTPPALPHFKCYNLAIKPSINTPVTLFDQFHPSCTKWENDDCVEDGEGEDVTLKNPHYLCTQVEEKCFEVTYDGKTTTHCEELPVINSRFDHLECYKIAPSAPGVGESFLLGSSNKPPFPDEEVKVQEPELVCVPVSKSLVPTPTPTPTPTPQPSPTDYSGPTPKKTPPGQIGR